ncbi:MAG: preprotein translocase subunit SecE [Bacteroidales bacterium]|nr:preprotein translocase subunit SecE [Bacteroidales bacterium]
MKKLVNYFKECYKELVEKVTWPTWTDLRGSAVVVSIASLIIALVVYMMDKSFETLLEGFYRVF